MRVDCLASFAIDRLAQSVYPILSFRVKEDPLTLCRESMNIRNPLTIRALLSSCFPSLRLSSLPDSVTFIIVIVKVK